MSYLQEMARSVARYQPADRPALRDFQREHFGVASRHLDDGFFEWLFERNPHRDSDGATLWLCKRDGAVVGQQASIPVMLKVGEAEHRAAWLIDWMVHRDWRLKGVATALFAATTARTDITLGLGLEEPVYRTILRAGWTDLGTLPEFVRPIDPAAFASGADLSHRLARLTPQLLARGSALAIGRVGGALSRLSISCIPAFDEDADGLWRRACADYTVLAKRDFRTLRWRYDDGPYRSLYERYYFKRNGELVGYAVVRLEHLNGHVIGRVIDYLLLRRWLGPAFALLIEKLAASAVAAAVFEQRLAGCEPILRSLGCVRTRSSHRFVLKATAPVVALTDPQLWFVTPGDADLDHILAADAAPAA